MFKGAGAVGRCMQAAVSMRRLAPHDFKSSAVPDLRCATRICCVWLKYICNIRPTLIHL